MAERTTDVVYVVFFLLFFSFLSPICFSSSHFYTLHWHPSMCVCVCKSAKAKRNNRKMYLRREWEKKQQIHRHKVKQSRSSIEDASNRDRASILVLRYARCAMAAAAAVAAVVYCVLYCIMNLRIYCAKACSLELVRCTLKILSPPDNRQHRRKCTECWFYCTVLRLFGRSFVS